MFHVASKILKEISFTYSQLPTGTRIVQYPFGNAAFSILLDKAFVDSGLDSQRFPELTSHKGLNVVLLPLWTVLLRMRGVRLINFHWITGPWQPPGANTRLRRSILWAFFVLWINIIKVCRIRIVYTVHDHEPHSQVFNDDKKAVKYLLKKSNGIVFLNIESKNVFSDYANQLSVIISEGSIRHPVSKTRNETREILNVPPANKLLVLVGLLFEYKGVDLIFSKLKSLPTDVSIRIAGTAPTDYEIMLTKLKENSDWLNLDIQIKFGFLSDSEFGEYLQAADYFLYPCRTINNSGSLNAALTHGLPVVVPQIPGLNWVPENCKIYIKGETPETYEIQSAIESLRMVDVKEYEELSSNATNFSEIRSWPIIAQQYRDFYEKLLQSI
jgi:glycosyltransferase involved in cell wall biosynthesis